MRKAKHIKKRKKRGETTSNYIDYIHRKIKSRQKK
jgi:hypothetical protein